MPCQQSSKRFFSIQFQRYTVSISYLIVVFFLAGVVCPNLENPPNGRVSLPAEPVFGDQATYTCNGGLVPDSGNTTRTCEANGQWSGSEPTCGKQLQSIFISYHNTTKLVFRNTTYAQSEEYPSPSCMLQALSSSYCSLQYKPSPFFTYASLTCIKTVWYTCSVCIEFL